MKDNKSKVNSISPQEISLFCQQILLILKSDIPLEDGIKALCEDTEDEKSKIIFEKLYKEISEFSTLHDALVKCEVFPPYMLGMVEIGEKSGKLEDTIQELSFFYEREDKLHKSILGAVCYPLFLMTMMTIVLSALVWKVLPIFRQIIEGFGASTAASTANIVNLGETLGMIALIFVIILLTITAFFYTIIKTNKNSSVSKGVLKFIPMTKKVSSKMALSRFASVMYTMFVSGYRAEDALDMVKDVLEDDTISQNVSLCKEKVNNGSSLSEALTETKMFTGIYARMIGIGFRTGNIDIVMKKLSEIYGDEAKSTIDNIVSIIEPVLVGALSILIGVVLLSVMLPLVGAMSSIG